MSKDRPRRSAPPGIVAVLALLILSAAAFGQAPAPDLVLVFTHDLHSSVLPHRVLAGDGRIEVRGGFARIAALLKAERARSGDRVLAVDGGDLVSGTLFQTLFVTEAAELKLLGSMGFEATTLGNHDFDLGPDSLARALEAARTKGRPPALLAANVVFSASDPRDASLRAAFAAFPVRERLVIERNGLRIGLFGLFGRNAADDAPDAEPVTFADPVARAREVVRALRQDDKADLVICLSHLGTNPIRKLSEDEDLAASVPGIDVIVSGHSHTTLARPLVAGTTAIVSCGSAGELVGVLSLARDAEGRFRPVGYELRAVTADFPEDPEVAAEVAAFLAKVDASTQEQLGLDAEDVLAEAAFSLPDRLVDPSRNGGEIGLGNLVTDAYRGAVIRAGGGSLDAPLIVIHPLGNLRDGILKGPVSVADVFHLLSQGQGPDGRAGYPLVAIWLTGTEVRRLFEVETSVAPGDQDARLEISGARVRYNPRRMIFDRVTSVEVEEADGTFRPLERKKLYRVAANLYMAGMIGYVSRASKGILKLEPKDAEGRPVTEMKRMIVDADPAAAGVQEIKEWAALAGFLRSFPDPDGNGLPEIPASYASPAGRIKVEPSWNPIALLSGAHAPTLVALGLAVVLILAAVLVIRAVRRRRARRAP